ncbi:MAG: hypothetical protein J6A50_01205 [Clostridia bacterium]|nr:hypothetical protein [Clostridia bacterium]
MKRIATIIISLFTILSLVGCNRILGGSVLEFFGMEFTSQIEMMEECLAVDLDDLKDSDIKIIYSYTDPDGNELTIRYLDLEGAGEFVENDIINSDNWKTLPYDSMIENLLETSGANEQYNFKGIEDGYYVISGVCDGKDKFDFDCNNFSEWYCFEVGIWDSNDETLYFISITDQTKI